MNVPSSLKILDDIIDFLKGEREVITRSEVANTLNELSRKRLRCSITYYVDETGDIQAEVNFNMKNNSVNKVFGSKH